jgi:hypothetical protein
MKLSDLWANMKEKCQVDEADWSAERMMDLLRDTYTAKLKLHRLRLGHKLTRGEQATALLEALLEIKDIVEDVVCDEVRLDGDVDVDVDVDVVTPEIRTVEVQASTPEQVDSIETPPQGEAKKEGE